MEQFAAANQQWRDSSGGSAAERPAAQLRAMAAGGVVPGEPKAKGPAPAVLIQRIMPVQKASPGAVGEDGRAGAQGPAGRDASAKPSRMAELLRGIVPSKPTASREDEDDGPRQRAPDAFRTGGVERGQIRSILPAMPKGAKLPSYARGGVHEGEMREAVPAFAHAVRTLQKVAGPAILSTLAAAAPAARVDRGGPPEPAKRAAPMVPGITAPPAHMLPTRSYAFGGIASSPQVAIFAEKPGMREAFVPLPGPNRGIPVEFPKGAPSSIQATFNLVVNSLDPKTAADAVLAQMPAIERALMGTLHNGSNRRLINTIRALNQ